MKKINKKLYIAFFCAFLAVCMLLLNFSSIITYAVTSINNQKRDFILKEYDDSEIENSVITLRNDIMNITKRNLPRDETQELGDDFTLVDFETGESRFAHTTFKSYPRQPGHTKQTKFDKYMLLRQSMYIMKTALKDAENGTLKKHPGIKYLYGEVEGQNNAVEKEIIIDPKYRSLHTTGLYLPAGEVITVKIESLKKNEQIGIVTHRQTTMGHGHDPLFMGVDNYIADAYSKQGENTIYDENEITLSSQYDRNDEMLPYIGQTYYFSENKEYKFGTPFGGILHLDVSKTNSPVKITFSGAVETPHYILGSTTEEYFEKYLRNSPGLYSCLDTENGLLIGPDEDMRKVDDIKNLALLWHSFFSINETFTGGSFDFRNTVLFDYHVPAGAAVALGGGVYACPNYMYTQSMSFSKLLSVGTWGVLHEIGHTHGNAYGKIWGFSGNQEGEVRNNALITLCYIKLCDMNPQINSIEHGFVAHQYTNLKTSIAIQGKNDFNDYDYFQALSMYANLMHTFGADKFYDLLYSYKTNPTYISNSRADFIYRCYKIYNLDFRYYFNTMYKANVDASYFTSEQNLEMEGAKEYIPIANLYANGTNGFRTSSRYKVYNNTDNILDIEGNMVCPTDYEIEKITNPKYGKLTKVNDKYVYRNNNKSEERFDSFDIHIKFKNGYSVVLNIFLELTYNGSRVSYSKVTAPNIDSAIIEMNSKNPDNTVTMPQAGVKNMNLQSKYYATSDFQFYADKDGEYRFYMKSDDVGRLYIVENNTKKLMLYNDSHAANYNKNKYYSASLKKGDTITFYAELYNIGGVGSLNVGYTLDDNQTPNDINPKYVFPTGYDKKQIEKYLKYKYIPRFISSDKSNEKVNSLRNSKDKWEVLQAPIHQSGEYEADGYNKRNYLIDDNTSTIFHSSYTGKATPLPHEYTIDTGEIQNFNFVKIYTRNNVNSFINKYEILLSDDNVNYKIIDSGDKLSYNSLVATINFETSPFRYVKVIIKSATGGHFSVISEIDTGISTSIEKLIAPTSNYMKLNNFIQNHNNSVLPSSYIYANKKNSSIQVSFIGNKISVFGITGISNGLAEVYIDGKLIGEINQFEKEIKTRQLLFHYDALKDKEHTLKIVTKNNDLFNIGYFNLGYESDLVNLNAPNYWWIFWLCLSLAIAAGIGVTIFILYKKGKIKIFKNSKQR